MILVIVEQREGKLNRVSWETLTAGQAIAAETGWPLEAAVVGGSVASLAADVSFAGDAPWFVTFQNGAFRGDKVEAGASAAPVETVAVDIAEGVVRNKPQEVFKEAKQAVDLTQAEVIVAVGRGIKEQKNIEIAKQLADALGG